MIAELKVYPENAVELMTVVAIPCCDKPDVMTDSEGHEITWTCRACGMHARTTTTKPQLRSGNPLKNRQAILKAMVADLDTLAGRWNYRIITGMQMED